MHALPDHRFVAYLLGIVTAFVEMVTLLSKKTGFQERSEGRHSDTLVSLHGSIGSPLAMGNNMMNTLTLLEEKLQSVFKDCTYWKAFFESARSWGILGSHCP